MGSSQARADPVNRSISISFCDRCYQLVQVKIGDFGFTKRVPRDKPSLKVARITHPRWVAPEVGTTAGRGPAHGLVPLQS